MNQELERVEGVLRTALAEAANDLRPPASPPLAPGMVNEVTPNPSQPRHTWLAPALVVAATVVLLLGVVVYFGAKERAEPKAPTATEPATPSTTLAPALVTPTGVGPEVKLSRTHNADTDFLQRYAANGGRPMTDPVIVQTPGRAPVIVDNPGSMTIAFPGPGGYQGGGNANPATTLTVTNAEAADPDADATWYVVWTQVPEGTAYVVYSYRSQLSWQRPIDGVSVFTVFGKGNVPAADRPFARAFDDNGHQIGEAHILG